MEVPGQEELALADTACRILVVSPVLDQATAFIQHLRELSSQWSTTTPDSIPPPDGTANSFKTPWTISNRYYTAAVHFSVHIMHGLSPHLMQNVPAIIFVWAQGESYKHHIQRLAQDLSGYEPEVVLAVRLGNGGFVLSDPEDGTEEDSEIDGFLSSNGFEFVDATVVTPPSRGKREEGDDSYEDGIPHLPRVLDALSTIMWPSMQSREQGGPSRGRDLVDWAQVSHDNSLSAVEGVVSDSSKSLSAGALNMRREMEELAKWLEEDEPSRDDPWKFAATSGAATSSPTEVGTEFNFCNAATIREPSLRFEDDFTVFVSAPPELELDPSGRSTPDISASATSLQPALAGSLYNSLGSASDLGEPEQDNQKDEVHRDHDDDEDDDDEMPTKEEIREATSRIFGQHGASKVSQIGSLPSKSFIEPSPFDVGDGGVDQYDMAPFDLTRVLGALQGMKAEIAGMQNENERRKAAARVALGLVYGLEADGSVDVEAEVHSAV
ncbi:hypothetical protein BDN72DRAFT_634880 [Pluteus cervinus]|uniref:Uncharacterized protein n=1 Tax=Pluteus cervinus TaxID=181527 RepID=A0ACD3BAU4_9AGAR|nr:hypothetical protein BDN72DRAFT_634880 [Pluteus cervinus]